MAETIKTRTTPTPMEEFLAISDDNRIIELLDGEIVMTPPATDWHQSVSGSLYIFIHQCIKGGILRYAPIGLYVDEQNFVEPDLLWISEKNTQCELDKRGFWHGTPDLIVEILSPSTALRDKRVKFKLYEKLGVREYWIVDPEAKYIEVYHQQDGKFIQLGIYGAGEGESFTSTVLPKSEVEVDKAFDS